MRKGFFSRKQKAQKALALKRIRELFVQAERAKQQSLKDRYAELACKLALKYRIRLSREFKKRFCKNCKRYWIPGITVRVRVTRAGVVYTCLRCNAKRRFPKS